MRVNTVPLSLKIIKILAKYGLVPNAVGPDGTVTRSKVLVTSSWYTLSLSLSLAQALYSYSRLLAYFVLLVGGGKEDVIQNARDRMAYVTMQLVSSVIATIALLFIWNLASLRQEFATLFNQMVTYRGYLAEKNILTHKDFKLLKIATAFILVRYGGNTLRALGNPRKSQYWFSLLPEDLQRSLIWRGIFSLYTIQLALLTIGSFLFSSIILMLYMDTVNVAMEHRIKNLKSKITTSTQMMEFRKLQVLSSLYNHCFSTVIWPTVFTAAVTMGVMGWYGSIRIFNSSGNKKDLFMYSLPAWACIYFSSKIFPNAAQPYELSCEEKRLIMWELAGIRNINAEGRKEKLIGLRSYRPLEIKLSSYVGTTITRTTALSILNLIVIQTVQMLIYF